MPKVKRLVAYQCRNKHKEFFFSFSDRLPKWLKCRVCNRRMLKECANGHN